VPHDADWTYSVVFPPGHEWHLLPAVESYRRIHDWLRLAFGEIKIETELAPCCKKSLPGQCFAGHEKSDLLWHGKKIAGAAQRRNKSGLLIQGSIQPPPAAARARVDFEQAMRAAAENIFGADGTDFAPDAELRRRAEDLAGEKFARVGYNQRR
jgi:lipoyl(octanoyl) transferase